MAPLGAEPAPDQLWNGCNPFGVSGSTQYHSPGTAPACRWLEGAAAWAAPAATPSVTRAASAGASRLANHPGPVDLPFSLCCIIPLRRDRPRLADRPVNSRESPRLAVPVPSGGRVHAPGRPLVTGRPVYTLRATAEAVPSRRAIDGPERRRSTPARERRAGRGRSPERQLGRVDGHQPRVPRAVARAEGGEVEAARLVPGVET